VTSPRLTPTILYCLAATWLIWGSTYLAIRFALLGFAPFFLMATRFVCAGSLLFVWQLARGVPFPRPFEWRNAAIVGALMLGGGMGGTAYSEMTVGSGIVVAFIAVTPLLFIFFNLAFRIYPSGRDIVAVVVGLAGVLMLAHGAGFQASHAGLVAITIACSSWTLGSVLSQRGFRLASGAMGFASEMLCGGVALLVLSAVAHESWHWPLHVAPWIAWWYLVVFGSLLAFSAYMILLERVTSSLASSYTLVNPVVALILGVTLGSESVSGWEWIAAAIILSALVLLLWRRRAEPAAMKQICN
jgi:drug/metabolite transporter (DMT)-like permease